MSEFLDRVPEQFRKIINNAPRFSVRAITTLPLTLLLSACVTGQTSAPDFQGRNFSQDNPYGYRILSFPDGTDSPNRFVDIVVLKKYFPEGRIVPVNSIDDPAIPVQPDVYLKIVRDDLTGDDLSVATCIKPQEAPARVCWQTVVYGEFGDKKQNDYGLPVIEITWNRGDIESMTVDNKPQVFESVSNIPI